MHLRIAAIAIRAAEREVEQIVDHGVHLAVFAPELMRRRPVPVDLGVVVVSIGVGVARRPVVAREAAGPGALDVRQRIEVRKPFRDRVDAAGRNGVVLELHAARAGGDVARQRVVDPLQRSVRVERAAEIAVANRRARHVEEGEQLLPAEVALVRSEKEQLIAPDRTAERPAERLPLDREFRRRCPPEEERRCIQLLIVEELEQRPSERIRARLGDDADGDAGRHALFSIHAARRDVDRLDRLGRCNVDVVVRQADVDVPGAVGERGVGRAILAVHRHVERPLRRVGLGILEGRRQRARHQDDERLIVPEAIERQIRDLGGPELRVDVRLVRLQQLGSRLDRDGLAHRANLKRQIDAADLANPDRHGGLHRFAESL